ncbi:MAG: phycobilisome degradation protein NblB [Microcoleaceae cyanobacterium]
MITPELIQEWLKSEDLGDRLRAVNQMRDIDPAVAFEMIQTAVVDSDTRVRYAAVSQLSSLGKQDLDKSLELLRDRLQTDPEADVQAAAADAIGGLQLKQAFPELKQLYAQTSEWLVKMSIVAALGELAEPEGFDLLADALQDENELIQTVAIGSLGELGNLQAVPLLTPYVTKDDWQIRYRVAQALGKLGGEEAQAALKQLAEDKTAPVAEAAKSALN